MNQFLICVLLGFIYSLKLLLFVKLASHQKA